MSGLPRIPADSAATAGPSFLPPLQPFAPVSLEFVEAFSQALRAAPGARANPELAALGFWMRRAHIQRLHAQFEASAPGQLFRPRGTAFHIAPSNVDSMFIYSWFLSLLCGNRNIVRLPSHETPGLQALLQVLDELLLMECWSAIRRRTALVRYDREDLAATTAWSRQCDVRVVWGGDATVSAVRQVPLLPHATEVCFANRFSLALVLAKGWHEACGQQREEWARRFFADAYAFGQMACSSPRLVVWLGDEATVGEAQSDFWQRVLRLAGSRGSQLMPVDYVNKLLAASLIAIRMPVSIVTSEHNDVLRMAVKPAQLPDLIESGLHCGAGLFYESRVEELPQLDQVLGRRVQTLCYAGCSDATLLRDYVGQRALEGVDRIVPFGRALEFSPIWDGIDLFRAFTRQVCVQ